MYTSLHQLNASSRGHQSFKQFVAEVVLPHLYLHATGEQPQGNLRRVTPLATAAVATIVPSALPAARTFFHTAEGTIFRTTGQHTPSEKNG